MRKIMQIFVAFSEKLNFTNLSQIQPQKIFDSIVGFPLTLTASEMTNNPGPPTTMYGPIFSK